MADQILSLRRLKSFREFRLFSQIFDLTALTATTARTVIPTRISGRFPENTNFLTGGAATISDVGILVRHVINPFTIGGLMIE